MPRSLTAARKAGKFRGGRRGPANQVRRGQGAKASLEAGLATPQEGQAGGLRGQIPPQGGQPLDRRGAVQDELKHLGVLALGGLEPLLQPGQNVLGRPIGGRG